LTYHRQAFIRNNFYRNVYCLEEPSDIFIQEQTAKILPQIIRANAGVANAA
jgi:hypothetical protein